MSFFFSRDTKVFMKFHASADGTDDALYEIPVLDGFSFSQATNSTEVTLNEAADSSGNSKRGRAMFNDSFAPAEWSFSTYMRPSVSDSSDTYTIASGEGSHAGNAKKFAVEGPLWGAMSATTYNLAVGGTGAPTIASFEPNVFNFQNSNKVALGVFDLYFVLGASKDTDGTFTSGSGGVMIYKIESCSIGSASIDFDIEGIAQVAWSGNGKLITEQASLNTAAGGETTKGLINEGITSTTNFIRQKLTDLAISYDASESTGNTTGIGGSDVTYALTLTGGNITIENNLTYLTPESLGTVNQPLGHVMGTRSVSGNFTCYLNDVSNGSADLFEALVESTGLITNAFALTFGIGGSGNTPSVDVAIPKAHLELPSHSIDDVIGIEVNFHGLSSDLSSATASSSANEVSITYDAS